MSWKGSVWLAVVLQAAGAAVAPHLLPKDQQTRVELADGETRRLELTSVGISPISLTVSPCISTVHWAVYYASGNSSTEDAVLLREYRSAETETYTTSSARTGRYIVQMRGASGAAAAADVLASGERPRGSRLRLRRSRQRRAAASWDPSPVDPQATEYCLVASARRAYSSLCAAHAGVAGRSGALDALHALQEDSSSDRRRKAHYKNVKYSRSTSVKDEDPVITCVGHKTHHIFDNLDMAKTYWVSVFGVSGGRAGGVLLARGALTPRAAHARSLREGRARRVDVRALGGRALFTYKTSSGNTAGFSLGVVVCHGPVDVQVSLRGRVVLRAKRIEQQARLRVSGAAAAAAAASAESADAELSVSSVSESGERPRARYLLKISARAARPAVVEVVASERARGVPVPELSARDVRELASVRACDALVVAWWPARSAPLHRYCIIARETPEGKAAEYCPLDSRVNYNEVQRMICRDIEAKQDSKQILTQRISGLQPGRRYSVLVTVSQDGGRAVAYHPLIAVTSHHCE